ncbi:MAG: serine hydrolase domain-containing protein [Actinomycetota bacterium]
MRALDLVAEWPVPTVAAAVVRPDGDVAVAGPIDHSFRIASISKMLVGWATLVAVEEGIVELDTPVGQPGCTLRHLLAHAGGYAFDGTTPIAAPGSRRIYSNTGIELAAALVAERAAMTFGGYLHDAVLEPLGMSRSQLHGSPAHGVHSTAADLVSFVRELRTPRLISAESALAFRTVQFPELAGMVPGIGRFDPNPWGLGTEVRGDKQPHWTGSHNNPSTFGHFGGAGTLLWVDMGASTACIALTDRPFDDWSVDALIRWPALADAVLAEIAGDHR